MTDMAHTTIVQWHPRFNHYLLSNQDTILLSETEELLIPCQQYPGFEQINGKNSLQDIANRFSDIGAGAMFYTQVEYFIQTKLLTEPLNPLNSNHLIEDTAWNNLSDKPTPVISRYNAKRSYSVYSFEHFSGTTKSSRFGQWLALLDDWHAASDSGLQVPINYLLLDDFLTDNMDLWASFETFDYSNTIMIKITGNHQWISPVFNSQDQHLFTGFIRQLWHNKPLRKLLQQLWPEQSHSAPYKICESHITDYQARYLKKLLANQHQTNKKQLVGFDLGTYESSHHPINTYLQPQCSFSVQLDEAIQLTSNPITYDDGGSRSQPAAKTLAALKHLISPITGVITHLSAIDTSKLDNNRNDPDTINIYRSAFFKTPTGNHIHSLNLPDFVQVSLGKGVSHEQSQVSALCETLERYAALCQGDEPMKKASPKDLDAPYFTYQHLSPFSVKQYDDFASATGIGNNHTQKQAVVPYCQTEIAWVPAWSLCPNHKKVWLPFTTVFSHTGLPEERYGRWHSNGCAAGNTLEEAILQALMELIERDAVAIWWYNQLKRPVLDKACVPGQAFARLDSTLSINHDYWMLDLTHDLQIPCVAAIAQDKQQGGLTLGFGAHLQPAMAAQRALTELCQLIPVREQNKQAFDFDKLTNLDFLYPGTAQMSNTDSGNVPGTSHSSGDIKKDIEQIVQHLAKLGLEAFAVNYSRAELPVKTAKVVVPGLCHIWPQLANKRLYLTPLRMGWLSAANTETTINPISLLI